jgi:hypothetical protein
MDLYLAIENLTWAERRFGYFDDVTIAFYAICLDTARTAW